MSHFIVYPVHLFKNIDELRKYRKIYILEDPIYFSQFNFHKQKILYLRTCMKNYYTYLKNEGIANVKYVEFFNANKFYKKEAKNGTTYQVFDFGVEKKLKLAKIKVIKSLNFVQPTNLKGKISFVSFYKMQRQRLNILMTKSGGPVGGRWSFDRDNRSKLDTIPPNIQFPQCKIDERKYVDTYFRKNYGEMSLQKMFPTNHKDAHKWMVTFFTERLKNFGKYEDAISSKYWANFHSVLTPMMNVGLLTDTEVLNELSKYKSIPINSIEGFVRQIIGWRNYILYNYTTQKYKKSVYKKTRPITKSIYKSLWEGSTGIDPIDNIIKTRIIPYAYCHHIERLMLLGNYMNILRINSKSIYRMFMEWTIDAYEWVMVPNVYGMLCGQGKLMTRPYISSSNYILKMSDYPRGTWADKYDKLYRRFIKTNQNLLSKNYATAAIVKKMKFI